jgi:riboflavin-specific deaminase-like protein
MALKLSLWAALLSLATAFMHSSIYQHTQNKFFAARSEITSALNLSASEENNEQPIIVNGVTLKMAFDSSSVWGVADLSETKSERFTSPESLDMVHRLRRDSSAVLVGRGTVEFDNCSLTVRRVELGEGQEQPVRVILDPSLSLVGGDYAIFKDGLRTIIYYSQTAAQIKDVSLPSSSDCVTFVPLAPLLDAENNDKILSLSPSQIIQDLSARGLTHIMVEGGPATARAFLHAGVVDRAILVRAPVEFQIPVPALMDEDTLKTAGLNMIGTAEMGGDVVEYWTREGMEWPNPDNLSSWP